MSIASSWSIIFILTMFVELASLVSFNIRYAKEKIEKTTETMKVVETRTSRSLTLTVASTAAMSFLLTNLQYQYELKDPILIIGLSLAIFLISFFIEDVALEIRFFNDLQRMLVDFGCISLLSGLGLAYGVYAPELQALMVLAVAVLMLIQIINFTKMLWRYLKGNRLRQH